MAGAVVHLLDGFMRGCGQQRIAQRRRSSGCRAHGNYERRTEDQGRDLHEHVPVFANPMVITLADGFDPASD
jgi:hypothetical protein